MEGIKLCSKCKKKKVRSKFYKNKNTKDGLYSYCKPCSSERSKEFTKEKVYTNKIKRAKSKAMHDLDLLLFYKELEERDYHYEAFDGLMVFKGKTTITFTRHSMTCSIDGKSQKVESYCELMSILRKEVE